MAFHATASQRAGGRTPLLHSGLNLKWRLAKTLFIQNRSVSLAFPFRFSDPEDDSRFVSFIDGIWSLSLILSELWEKPFEGVFFLAELSSGSICCLLQVLSRGMDKFTMMMLLQMYAFYKE